MVRTEDWRALGIGEEDLVLQDGSRRKVVVERWEAVRSAGPLPGNAVNALLGRVNAKPFLHFQPMTLRFVAVQQKYGLPVTYHFAHLATGWTNCGRADDYAQMISGRFVSGFDLLFHSSAS